MNFFKNRENGEAMQAISSQIQVISKNLKFIYNYFVHVLLDFLYIVVDDSYDQSSAKHAYSESHFQ